MEQTGPSGPSHPSMSATLCQDHSVWGEGVVTQTHLELVTWGQLCSLLQVIETMERVLQEKRTGVGRSTEKTAGGCKWRWGPSRRRHPYTAAGSPSGGRSLLKGCTRGWSAVGEQSWS